MEELVAIARIVRTRGLKGEVVAEILTDFPERFENLETAIGLFPDGGRRDLNIEKFFFQKGRIVLKFAGYNSIEDAEALRNTELCIPETDAAALKSDEFFDWQLIGCKVHTVGGEMLGEVREVMRTGGPEILVVQGEARDFMIPFAEAICTGVDIENRMITIDPPDGLLDF